MKRILMSYQDWLKVGSHFGLVKSAQDMGAPPGGGGGGAPVGGTLSGIDANLVDAEESNDQELIRKMNKAFHRALRAGKEKEDALMLACQAVGSRLFPKQLDVDEVSDPPMIRGWSGLELGPPAPKPPAGAPPAAPPGGM